ncbi:tenascin-N-like [Clavelina lepadiformis]|uniref:tenascin-N-like n=1 Tax=Clavelina lepadiformis TaxID=159417 RepID=UPI00404272E5
MSVWYFFLNWILLICPQWSSTVVAKQQKLSQRLLWGASNILQSKSKYPAVLELMQSDQSPKCVCPNLESISAYGSAIKGYVTPSADDTDEYGKPYGKRFRFSRGVGLLEKRCSCDDEGDLQKLKQQNKALRSAVSSLEKKLVRRLKVLESLWEKRSDLSACRKTYSDDLATLDVIDSSLQTSPWIQKREACPNNCSSNGKCTDGLCNCKRGFDGNDCSNSRCLNACSGHGTCNKHGKCRCWGQWVGSDCSRIACQNGCHGNGRCNNGVCSCFKGYEGLFCESLSCPNSCSGHGKCDVTTGTCSCEGTWIGVSCSKRRCPRDCSGQGVCVKGLCQCFEHWQGKACNKRKCPNDCSSNGKCRNGMCICGTKWIGEDCSQLNCPSDCSGTGKCESGSCVCEDGWAGKDCSQQQQCPDECSFHGSCVASKCECNEGWDGANCAVVRRPSGLTVNNIQPNSIDVSWRQTSTGLTGNQVNCIPMSGTANAVYQTVGPNVTKLTIRDLDSGIQYSVYVYAMIEDELSAPLTASVKTAVDAPTKLGWLRIGDTFAEVSWSPPKAPIDHYKIVCSCKEGGAEFSVLPNKTSVLISDLYPGEFYSVSLYAVQEVDYSVPVRINFTTSLDPAQDLQFLKVTSSSATAQWKKSRARAEGYRISVALYDGDGASILTGEVSGSENRFSVEGLTPDSKYNVSVSTFRKNLQSLPLNGVLLTGIEPPTNFSLSKILATEAHFRWDSPNPKIRKFRVVVYLESHLKKGLPSLVDTVLDDDTYQASFTNLLPGNTYVIEVYSLDEYRLSGPLTHKITTAVQRPSNLQVLSSTATSVCVRWNSTITEIDEYIAICTNIDNGKVQDAQLLPEDSDGELSAVFHRLCPATKYNISVVAQQGLKKSAPSSIIAITALLPPERIAASSPSHGDLVIVWDPVREFGDASILGIYHVNITPVHGKETHGQPPQEKDFRLPRDITALTVPNMAPGVTYNIKIISKSHDGHVPPSLPNVINFTVPLDPPQAVSVAYVTYRNATITWFPPSARINAYQVSFQDLYQIEDVVSLEIPFSQTNVTLSGLTDDTSYVVNVTSVMHKRSSVPASSVFTTDLRIIEPVEYLHATDVTCDAISVEWIPSISDDVDGYYITVEKNKEKKKVLKLTVDSDNLMATFTGLDPSCGYLISVYTTHQNRRSIPIQLNIKTRLDPPRELMSVIISDSSMTVQWRGSLTVVSNYVVTYYRTNVEENKKDILVQGSVTICSIHDLEPATQYTVEVVAIGDSSQSAPAIVFVTTLPGSVIQLKSPKQGVNHILLTWVAPDEGGEVTGYQVEYRLKENLLNTKTLHLHANETQVTLRDLKPARKYTISVYSKNFFSLGESRVITVATTILPVRSAVAQALDDHQVIVRWKSPPDVSLDGYKIEHRTLESMLEYSTAVVSSDVHSYVIRGLIQDTQYSIKISPFRENFKSKTKQIKATTASALESPASLNISDIRDTSADVSWEEMADETITGYTLRYKPVGGSTREVVHSILGRKMTSSMLMKLRPATLYYVSVVTERRDRESFPPVTQRFLTAQPLTPPNKIKVEDIHETTISLSWLTQKSDLVEEYHVTYSKEEEGFEGSKVVSADKDTTRLVMADLKPCTTYTIDIHSFRWGTDSSDAASISVKTLHPLLPPTNVSFIQVNQTGVTVAWKTQTPDVDGYDVILQENGSNTRNFTVSNPSTQVSVNNLTPGSRYGISVIARRKGKRSEESFAHFQTDDRLEPPYNIMVMLMGETGAKLSWKVPVQDFDKIALKYTSSDQSENGSYVFIGVETSYELIGLQPGTLYYVTMTSHKRLKTSAEAHTSFTTGYFVPRPAHLRFAEIEETTLLVKWDKTSDRAQYYRIIYATENQPPRMATHFGNVTEMTLEYLSSGTTYDVRVTAIGKQKSSSAVSRQVSTLLRPPVNTRVQSVTTRSIEISWDPLPVEVDEYRVEYNPKMDFKEKHDLQILQLKGSNTTTANITGLFPGTKYVFEVVALKKGQASRSVKAYAQTELDPPSKVRTSVIARRSANLTWALSQADDVTAYQVKLFTTLGAFSRTYNLTQYQNHIWLRHLQPNTPYSVQVIARSEKERSEPSVVHFKTGKVPFPRPKNCFQVLLNGELESGIYDIHIGDARIKNVFCDLELDGGGWTIIQRRNGNDVDFDRNWNDYVDGFGNPTGNFWIGLHILNELTMNGGERQELRIDFRHEEMSAFASYKNFTVSGEISGFILNATDYVGTAGDSLTYHIGMRFSTKDLDNDNSSNRNCAKEYGGGWWFRNCHRSNLNGQYNNTKHSKGVNWHTWGGFTRSIQFVEMKMRPHRHQAFWRSRKRQQTRQRRSRKHWRQRRVIRGY